MQRRVARLYRIRNPQTVQAAQPASSAYRRLGAKVAGTLGGLGLALILSLASTAAADPASSAPADGVVEEPIPVSTTDSRNLDVLLVLPTAGDGPTAAERTDAYLAAEVASRGGDQQVATAGFRKRSVDLFRHERAVEVGEQEMLLRLRLRAKTRETMSVELRF
ncbi:MAG: hypothetical protein ACPGVZ_14170 [Myxococcota bacterium]